ncbi:CA [Mytilus edulis]|uniref:carbonic anhydrase n=1 Tax=Mytilus edulis TaxID=6550 RepID=A0A8S3QUD7_MYTED|nr:CA [Mytilus edulis]
MTPNQLSDGAFVYLREEHINNELLSNNLGQNNVRSCVIENIYGKVDIMKDRNIWGYQDGIPPQNWPRLYPECFGRKQSPINIDTRQVVLNTKIEPFDFSNINTIHGSRMTIVNHGKTVEVEVLDDNWYNTGGGLHGRHIVKQFHFHWGNADHRGSEHDVDGKQFPMEEYKINKR